MDYARRVVEGEEGPGEEDLMEEGDGFDEVDTTMEDVKKSVSEVKSAWSICSDICGYFFLIPRT